MKYLAQCGATPCAAKRGSTPLHKAELPAVVDFLIEIGADVNAVNSAGEIALHRADNTGIDVARCLIAHKADVNARDNDGKTPLHSAYSDGIVQLLIDHKADARALDNTGKTPLHYYKFGDCVKILVESGADIEAVDVEGMTPLMTVIRACGSSAKLLLQSGASPRAVDLKGRTALHYINASTVSDIPVYTLVKKKADPNIRDNDGKTPLDLATDRDVIFELRKVGAKRSVD
jgi:ankyrin repeat protein